MLNPRRVSLVSYPNHLSEAYCSAHSLANEIEVAIGARKPAQKLTPKKDMSKEVERMTDKDLELMMDKEVELMMDKYFKATKKKCELAAANTKENEGAQKGSDSQSST